MRHSKILNIGIEYLVRIKNLRLRYVDWINKKTNKHHHRIFLDVVNTKGLLFTAYYLEFKTRKEAVKFMRGKLWEIGTNYQRNNPLNSV